MRTTSDENQTLVRRFEEAMNTCVSRITDFPQKSAIRHTQVR